MYLLSGTLLRLSSVKAGMMDDNDRVEERVREREGTCRRRVE